MRAAVIKGFTLVELIVTLSVGSILLAVAVPGYQTFVQNNRLTTQNNNFASALMLAKSEAVKRSSWVTVCPSTSGTGCTGGTTWSGGWLIFADADNDNVADAGEEIIKVNAAMVGGNTLTSGNPAITFSGSGFSQGSNDTFTLCDKRGSGHSKVLVLSNLGRLRAESGTGTCA